MLKEKQMSACLGLEVSVVNAKGYKEIFLGGDENIVS